MAFCDIFPVYIEKYYVKVKYITCLRMIVEDIMKLLFLVLDSCVLFYESFYVMK